MHFPNTLHKFLKVFIILFIILIILLIVALSMVHVDTFPLGTEGIEVSKILFWINDAQQRFFNEHKRYGMLMELKSNGYIAEDIIKCMNNLKFYKIALCADEKSYQCLVMTSEDSGEGSRYVYKNEYVYKIDETGILKHYSLDTCNGEGRLSLFHYAPDKKSKHFAFETANGDNNPIYQKSWDIPAKGIRESSGDAIPNSKK